VELKTQHRREEAFFSPSEIESEFFDDVDSQEVSNSDFDVDYLEESSDSQENSESSEITTGSDLIDDDYYTIANTAEFR